MGDTDTLPHREAQSFGVLPFFSEGFQTLRLASESLPLLILEDKNSGGF